jgi:hypothetical protein
MQIVQLPLATPTRPSYPSPPPARIEDMRRSIGVASASAAGDQLQLLEVLGEGAFGKVRGRGRWVGRERAVGRGRAEGAVRAQAPFSRREAV